MDAVTKSYFRSKPLSSSTRRITLRQRSSCTAKTPSRSGSESSIPSFQGLEKSDRHSRIWKYLESLPEELQSDISMVVLLTPAETPRSLANLEFEDPPPSLI